MVRDESSAGVESGVTECGIVIMFEMSVCCVGRDLRKTPRGCKCTRTERAPPEAQRVFSRIVGRIAGGERTPAIVSSHLLSSGEFSSSFAKAQHRRANFDLMSPPAHDLLQAN